MKNNGITPHKIDFEKMRQNRLDESMLAFFGAWIKDLLFSMFGDTAMPVVVKGRQSDLKALASVLGQERRYMESFMKHGLNNPSVLNNRHSLERAVHSFETETGIKWPLK